jgi:hypothetical protein
MTINTAVMRSFTPVPLECWYGMVTDIFAAEGVMHVCPCGFSPGR